MIESSERNSLLGAFAITGDGTVAKAYSEMMYGSWGIASKFPMFFPRGQYGKDLDLILLEFFVLGELNWFSAPQKISMGRYSKKNKDISVKIPIPMNISLAILNNDESIVKNFIFDTFSTIGDLIGLSKPLKKTDFDVERFKKDYAYFMENLFS
ncbi:hypothetical protein [Neisseria dumasiana]|uniref:Uncharacterized protein n=1 Tax=Neisseria dumasiana TaxID=1931275 RepID=A0A1X3DAF9_9NEIS|nr:hypothetical protein [Neisseria dumasiana]OSI16908.1 hypothetical protein BV912_11235 [Neisseria dumasiana]